jgi:hypothetical protein
MVVVVKSWVTEATAERQRRCRSDRYSSGSGGVDR